MKNKKNYLLLIFFLLLLASCNEKHPLNDTEELENSEIEECATPTPPPPDWFFEPQNRAVDTSTGYLFSVYIHVIRNNAGQGLDKDIVSNTVVRNLNNYFANSNISFIDTGSAYIDSDILLNGSNINSIFSKNRRWNAINIYVLSVGSGFDDLGIAGIAENIPSNACIINGSFFNTPTLPHEIGHCLGLYHTHHGTAELGSCPELVNGSNSTTCGDFITDTPADPNLWWDCSYIGTLTDANGQNYQPDPNNLMSYAGTCRDTFTPKQIERMHATIPKSSNLQASLYRYNGSISGPDHVGLQSTYTVNVPNDFTATWEVYCETYSTTGKLESAETTYGSGSTYKLVNKKPSSMSQLYTITVKFTHPQGGTYETKKIVRYIQASSMHGIFTWGSESPNGNKYFGTGFDYTEGISSGVIKIVRGGGIYFYYYDRFGGSSHNDTAYDFQILNNTSHFVKTSRYGYTCLSNSNSVFQPNLQIGITINGQQQIFSFPVEFVN